MFRIRRVYDNILSPDRVAIEQVQAMLTDRFPGLEEKEVAGLPEKLRNPVGHGFRAFLYVVENQRRTVKAFALVYHEAEIDFVWLEFLASGAGSGGSGIGGTLYERVRRDARELGAWGVLFECLPDDPALCKDPSHRRQNAARLRFYEGFGARPVTGTEYETPLSPDDDEPPYLVVDPLGSDRMPSGKKVQAAARAILDRKYGELCPPEYVERVISSFKDDPARLRTFRYVEQPSLAAITEIEQPPLDQRIALVVNDRHLIHHVRQRGYVESPVRIASIRRELDPTRLFEEIPPGSSPTATSSRSTIAAMSAISNGSVPGSATGARSTRTSFPSATTPARPRSSRCRPAITASTPSRRSTGTPSSPPGVRWIAR